MSDNKDLQEYSAAWWAKEIASQEKEFDKKFRNDGDRAVARFLDDRDSENDGITALIQGDSKRYNIFWTNTLITKSALYATPPSPLVKRQWDDAKDDQGRVASLILQRILTFDMNKQGSSSHSSFGLAVEDRLIPGLCQVWLRMEVKVEDIILPAEVDPATGQEIPPVKGQRVADQKVRYDYVNWRDFLWGPARTWEEVPWVARRLWMRRKAFEKQFGDKKYKEIKEYCTSTVGGDGKMPRGFKNGSVEVMEIWCKDSEKVYFLHMGLKDFCAAPKDDPLKLDEFFPCPKPLLATHTTNSLTPRSDYYMVADQYNELDVLNDRIATLTRALRVVGLYDSTNSSLAKLLSGQEMQMIPVDNWAALGEAGGLKGQVDWFPVEVIAGVLDKLIIQRQLVVQQIYELTGISDIMRGSSNPRDTLGAQKLKAQYSSVRLRLTQQDVAEFVCGAMRLACEIMCRHFEPDMLMKLSQIGITESAALAPQAIELLKNYSEAEYRVEITEESLSMADYTAEREMRVAYLTSVGQFLSQIGQMAAAVPASLPYLIRMIIWVTASFRGSDDIETVLDEAATAAMSLPQQPPQQEQKPQAPPPPDPMMVAQVETDGKIKQQTNEKNLELRNKLVEHALTSKPGEENDSDSRPGS